MYYVFHVQCFSNYQNYQNRINTIFIMFLQRLFMQKCFFIYIYKLVRLKILCKIFYNDYIVDNTLFLMFFAKMIVSFAFTIKTSCIIMMTISLFNVE